MKKWLLIFFILLSSILNAVDSFSTAEELTGTHAKLFDGEVSEYISSTIYKKNGYTQLDAEVGSHGIDGLYIKRVKKGGEIKTVVFSEVKHGKGQLGTIKKGSVKQMSKDWRKTKIIEKIESLKKKSKSLNDSYQIAKLKIRTDKLKTQIGDLETIQKALKGKSKIDIKTQITRINNMGDGKFTISINTLVEDNSGNIKVGKQLKHKLQDNIIDINAKHYKPQSDDWKIQKILKHSTRKQKRLLKEIKV